MRAALQHRDRRRPDVTQHQETGMAAHGRLREAWQLAMDPTELVYTVTRGYPPDERFGLAFHTRKTAVAVPSNLAEGTRRRTAGYLARVIDALAEHAELETQIILGGRLRYLDSKTDEDV